MNWTDVDSNQRMRMIAWLRSEAKDADTKVEDGLEDGPSDGPFLRAMATALLGVEQPANDLVSQILAALDSFDVGLVAMTDARQEQAREALAEIRRNIEQLAPPNTLVAITSDARFRRGELWAQPNIPRWRGMGLTLRGVRAEAVASGTPGGETGFLVFMLWGSPVSWHPDLEELDASWVLRAPDDILAEKPEKL